MYYVIGFTFKAGETSTVRRGGSVLQQMNQAKLNANATVNTKFETGKEYTIYYIKSVVEDKVRKFKYVFMDKDTKQMFDIVFANTYEADSYIARISGKTEELKDQRTKAQNTQEAI